MTPLILQNLVGMNEGRLLIPKIDLQLHTFRIVDNSTNYGIFDFAVVEVYTDFVTGFEFTWVGLIWHGANIRLSRWVGQRR